MSNVDVNKFFQKLEQDLDLAKEYMELMADNISLIVIVAFAKQLNFTFTTRELAEHLIRTSSARQAEEARSNILPFEQKAG